MAIETGRTVYTRLFEVRLLHHYWLDDGATPFDSIANASTRRQRLLTYDVRRVLGADPSLSTMETIAGLRGVFRMTGLGFLVAVPSDAVVPLDSTFEFHVSVRSPEYANYTSLTLRLQSIVDVVDVADPETPVLHRYKANVPVLSNLTGASLGTGSAKRLFLSRPYQNGASSGDGVEALVTSGPNLRQLTGDPPSAPFEVLGPKSEHPIYVHQGDVQPITPPAGTTGAPERGVELDADTPPSVVALVRLAPRRADDNSFSFTMANGTPRSPTRVFEVHLRNRWTTWRYRNRNTGSVTSTEPNPLPLTYFGNAGTRAKPSILSVGVERDAGPPSKITRLVSDIYV
ncbi:MAG TPA: hypothetical protein VJM33_16330 [Microthrixaceae bacterium]|nr:hypothetical protein [Microthrixaceae bacterium]